MKYDKKSQNGLEKETSRKHPHKIHENKENACLENLIFMSTLVRNRSFHFSRFVQISSKMAPKGAGNWGLPGFFSSKTWQERGLKNIQKTSTRKVRKNVKKVVQKDVPKSDVFLVFLGSGAKGAPGWSQGSLQAPSKVKFDWKWDQNGEHNSISMFFL